MDREAHVDLWTGETSRGPEACPLLWEPAKHRGDLVRPAHELHKGMDNSPRVVHTLHSPTTMNDRWEIDKERKNWHQEKTSVASLRRVATINRNGRPRYFGIGGHFRSEQVATFAGIRSLPSGPTP